jgi:hypothetical protein
MSPRKISIDLSESEAIILYEYLSNPKIPEFNNQIPPKLPSERTVLLSLENKLEKEVSMFPQDYGDALDATRKMIDCQTNQ